MITIGPSEDNQGADNQGADNQGADNQGAGQIRRYYQIENKNVSRLLSGKGKKVGS